MLKDGYYIYTKCQDDCGQFGNIILKVKTTDKSYIFELIENTDYYFVPHLDMLFKDKTKITISRVKPSAHAINTSLTNNWFCLYPCRAGVPYCFERIKWCVKDVI